MSRRDGLSYENNTGKRYFLEVSNHSTGATDNSNTDQVQK